MNYLIQGAAVVGPSHPGGGKATLFIQNGLVQPVPAGELPPGTEVIDASGCMVVPGLTDTHIHVNRAGGGFGENADLICIPNGVTTAIDAGSCGVNNIAHLLEGDAPGYSTDVRALLHAVSDGQSIHGEDERADPDGYEEERILAAFKQYPGRLCGLKLRCHAGSTRGYGLRSLERAVELADRVESEGIRCPVVAHLGPLPEGVTLEALLDALRPGDVAAHIFQGAGETALDERGRLRGCLPKARERGVLFDFAHGRTNFTFRILFAAAEAGFFPDMLGTDIHGGNSYLWPAFSMMNTLSMLDAAGMPQDAVVRALTETPRRTYGLGEMSGFLSPGSPADLAVIKKTPRPRNLTDSRGDALRLSYAYGTLLTMRGGKVLYRSSVL